MTENKNLNHTFSPDVNMPLCIRLITVSLIEVFYLFFFVFFFLFFLVGGGGGGAMVLCSPYPYRRYENIISDVVRLSGCPFIFQCPCHI